MIHKKNSSHRPSLFIDIGTRFPLLGWKLSKHIVQELQENVRTFQLLQGVEVLASLLKTTTKQVASALEAGDLKSNLEQISKLLLKILQGLKDRDSSGAFGMSRDRVKTLMKSVLTIVKCFSPKDVDQTFDKKEYAALWNSERLVTECETIADDEKFKCASLTNQVKQLKQVFTK